MQKIFRGFYKPKHAGAVRLLLNGFGCRPQNLWRIFEFAQLKYAKLHRRTGRIEELASDLNEKVQGWVNYFGKYAGSSMHYIYAQINRRLVKWCMWKYRKFKRQAIGWLYRKWQEKSMLFVHWQ